MVRLNYYSNLIFRIDIKKFKSLTRILILTVSKWTKIKYGVPQGSILCPLLFLVCINDLPKAIEHKAVPILFPDDIIILITSPNNVQFQSDLNVVFGQLNKLFKANLLSFNFDKTYLIHFNNKSTCTSDVQITYEDKFIQLLQQHFLGY